jgi:hypothetical protein
MRFLVLSLESKWNVRSHAARLALRLGLAPAIVIAACSDDGVGSPQATDAGGTAATSPGDGADDGGTAAGDDGDDGNDGDDGTGGGPMGTSGGADDSSTAGTAGSDGSTGGGLPTEPECRVDRDCMVVNDCCSCGAAPVDEMQPECPKACLQPSCDAIGLFDPVAECRLGLCQFVPKSCNPAEVTCDAPTPQCPDGMLPEVDGFCWTGECVPLQFCDIVPSCEDCQRHETCVVIETQLGPWYACEPIAPACDGDPSCACMAEICPESHDTCVDGEDGISCTCPQC